MSDEIPKCRCGAQNWQKYDLDDLHTPMVCAACGCPLEHALEKEDDELEGELSSLLDGKNAGSAIATAIGEALRRGALAKMKETKGEPNKADGMAYFMGVVLGALGKSMQPDSHLSLGDALHETLTEEGNLNGSFQRDVEEGRGEGSSEGEEPAGGSSPSGDAPSTGE